MRFGKDKYVSSVVPYTTKIDASALFGCKPAMFVFGSMGDPYGGLRNWR
jgi:hypothetical protein